MSLFARVDWAALERLMQPVRALLNEDLVSLAHEPQESRLRLWQELEAVRPWLRGLAGTLPAEVEVRCRGEQALAALRLAASFQPSPDAPGLPGITDAFNPEELELARGLEECKALDVLEASEVEQRQLDGLITRRSLVRIQPPLPSKPKRRPVRQLGGVFVLARGVIEDGTIITKIPP